ncbi:MAG TPA: polysaccharide deacetylase family protein, partial [Pyrinomonadaceae bacterium]|nr:polysaccharide deacetylase family protein [Pyrinomonadaceae bacterium]
MSRSLFSAFICVLLLPLSTIAQENSKTIAERLGYPRDAKLLIVHADDLGMAHSVNAATIKAFETGLVNSGSIMVPCPWLSEIATYARANPQADLGLHLTLTSEWTSFRWGPVSPRDRVTSLLDKDGYFRLLETEAATHADPKEVELEITTQIERAKALGIQPTHLDSHMGTLYQNKALFEVFLRVARKYKLPVRIAKTWFARADFLPATLKDDDVYIDRILDINTTVAPNDWSKFYSDA